MIDCPIVGGKCPCHLDDETLMSEVGAFAVVHNEIRRLMARQIPGWEGEIDLPGGGTMIVRRVSPYGQEMVLCGVFLSMDVLLEDPRVTASLGLTPRLGQVARLLANRRTNREIARELGISDCTARRHTEGVLQRLCVDDRFDVRARLLRVARRLLEGEQGTLRSGTTATPTEVEQ